MNTIKKKSRLHVLWVIQSTVMPKIIIKMAFDLAFTKFRNEDNRTTYTHILENCA